MKQDSETNIIHLNREGIRKVLGELEAEIMELIWDRDESEGISVRDVYEILRTRRPIAYTTVMTTMSRLAKKKLLSVTKVDQTYIYRPKVQEQEFTAGFVGKILDSLLVDLYSPTLSHFTRFASPEEKEEIAQLLDRIRELRARE